MVVGASRSARRVDDEGRKDSSSWPPTSIRHGRDWTVLKLIQHGWNASAFRCKRQCSRDVGLRRVHTTRYIPFLGRGSGSTEKVHNRSHSLIVRFRVLDTLRLHCHLGVSVCVPPFFFSAQPGASSKGPSPLVSPSYRPSQCSAVQCVHEKTY